MGKRSDVRVARPRLWGTLAAVLVLVLATGACARRRQAAAPPESTTAAPETSGATGAVPSPTSAPPTTAPTTEPPSVADPFPAGSSTHELTWGGRTRDYTVRVPDGATAGSRPLLLVLHGGGGDPEQAEAMGFDDVAGGDGAVTVYPAGVARNWNDGRDTDMSTAHREHVDDVGFLLAVLDQVEAHVRVDPDRVFAVGPSNGGMMTARLACEATDRFTAVGIVIASAPVPLAGCDPVEPLGVIMVAGTDDPLVPYEGGEVGRRGGRGEVIGVPRTYADWVAANGCGEPVLTRQRDRAPFDHTSIVRHLATGCEGGVQVELVEVRGGGHAWPGGPQYLPIAVIGRASREADAVAEIWDFLAAHHR